MMIFRCWRRRISNDREMNVVDSRRKMYSAILKLRKGFLKFYTENQRTAVAIVTHRLFSVSIETESLTGSIFNEIGRI